MNDNDLLDLVAADAPTPAAGYADDVLARARRARRRRGMGVGAAVSAAAAAAAAAILIPPAIGGGANPPNAYDPGPSVVQPANAVPDDALAYAVAIERLADSVAGGSPPVGVLFIVDHTCTNIVEPLDPQCHPEPLSRSLREDLTEALRHYAPVQFVADSEGLFDQNHQVIDDGVLVTLAPLWLKGDDAKVPLSVVRGGLNGQGLTYVLRRDGDTWKVTDTVGPQWIS